LVWFLTTRNCNGLHTDGCEVDINSDLNNCGACGIACDSANANELCVSGSCQVQACIGTFRDCNGLPGDGCEVNSATDVSNCGLCGTVCNLPNANETCVNSVCEVSSCIGTTKNCNGLHADGCEVNTNTNVNNCGTCGTICDLPNANEACNSGTCEVGSCIGTARNCNGTHPDGCEVDINTNVNNCGACGTACNLPHANPTCSGGACGVLSCIGTWRDCNGNPADGCEVDTGSNVNNCGGCGAVCNLPNANETCSASTCQVASCIGTMQNCNGTHSDGCEVDLNTNVNNCGSCNNICNLPNANEMCTAGACQVSSCIGSARNCNGTHSDGCEIDINSNVNHCGACGNVCNLPNSNEMCSSGTCQVNSCIGTWRNCDGSHPNGCETDTSGDINNCGACGTVCTAANASSTCSSSACTITDCATGFCNANGGFIDGCEYDLDLDPSCGSYIDLGKVSGDTGSTSGGCAGNTCSWTGNGERWFRVRVDENDSAFCSSENLCARITLNPNGISMDYDLYGYCDDCSGSDASSAAGSGSIDTITMMWDENTVAGCPTGTDSGRYLYLNTTMYSVDECNNYTISVVGDVCGSSNTCNSK